MNELYTAGFDGSSIPNPGEMKIGGWIKDSNQKQRYSFSRSIGQGTNNEAEYQALIHLLKTARRLEIKNIFITGDSALVVSQVNGIWKVKNKRMKVLHEEVLSLLKGMNWTLKHVVRKYNSEADSLTR